MIQVPEDSIYFWMYEQGLKHVPYDEVELAVTAAGKIIRQKDHDNYWNGYYNSDLYHGPGSEDIFMLKNRGRAEFCNPGDMFSLDYTNYEEHPYSDWYYDYPEIKNRWVPCSKDNKPMIKWGNGCMSLADAVAYPGQKYLAENLKGTRFIVIDCDGNHADPWDYETMGFLWHYAHMTHCITKGPQNKPGMLGYFKNDIPPSFHLTFMTSKIIPTMHFPYAHIDIAGNRRNQLRYWKDKKWNGVEPAWMTASIWNELREYIKYRKEKANASRNEC